MRAKLKLKHHEWYFAIELTEANIIFVQAILNLS
jgi:hypothetical protein